MFGKRFLFSVSLTIAPNVCSST